MSLKKHKPKIGIILGTRPEIIKLSPVIRICKEKKLNFFLLHTNQHYSAAMDSIFFKELGLPKPKYNLNIREKLHGKMTGRMLAGIEKVLIRERPDWVLVQGDTNTVLAGALAAEKLGIKIGHVEAGLRSYDRTMPEETNRILTDHMSDALFCPTAKEAKIAGGEGIQRPKIFVTGNTVVDVVLWCAKVLRKKKLFGSYKKMRFALLTLHRPGNVDNPQTLSRILEAIKLAALKNNLIVYFPIHPRTAKMLKKFHIQPAKKIFRLMKPVGLLEMLALEQAAKVVLTDSGGIQEEACILKVPCVTIRENTERPETLEVGSNVLVGSDPKKIQKGISQALTKNRTWRNPFGDGLAGKRIVKQVMR